MAIGTTVSGIFRNGVIELTELPTGISSGARVQVTFLEDEPTDPEQREALRQEAIAFMRKGIDLGGPPYPTREELNERTR